MRFFLYKKPKNSLLSILIEYSPVNQVFEQASIKNLREFNYLNANSNFTDIKVEIHHKKIVSEAKSDFLALILYNSLIM